MKNNQTENATSYRNRWPYILNNIITRLESNALYNPRCQSITNMKREKNEPLFMIFIWTATQPADSQFKGPTDNINLPWCSQYHHIFVQNMIQGIQMFIQQYPRYEKNIPLIDTVHATLGHFNPIYTHDGLHFINKVSGVHSNNVVTDMVIQLILNNICH